MNAVEFVKALPVLLSDGWVVRCWSDGSVFFERREDGVGNPENRWDVFSALWCHRTKLPRSALSKDFGLETTAKSHNAPRQPFKVAADELEIDPRSQREILNVTCQLHFYLENRDPLALLLVSELGLASVQS